MAGFDALQPWQPQQEQAQDWESSGNTSLDNMIKMRQQGNIRQRSGKLAAFLKALRMLGVWKDNTADQMNTQQGFGGYGDLTQQLPE